MYTAGGNVDDGVVHSWAWRTVGALTSVWHFLLPVLDDITNLWLLVKTFGGSHEGLWWTCLCLFIVADIERVYTALFTLVIITAKAPYFLIVCLCGSIFAMIFNENVGDFPSVLAGQDVDLDETQWLLLDSLLWTLFGSRARSSPFMGMYGLAGQATGSDLRRSGLGLHGIDVILYFHPMRYLGEFIMSFPRGHRREEVTTRDKAERKHTAMVRAVGETVCMDPLFLALSVVTGGWDDNISGFAMVSALFSMLELVTELQYYVTEAEASKKAINRNVFTAGTAEVVDIEVGDGDKSYRGPRPVESSGPVRQR